MEDKKIVIPTLFPDDILNGTEDKEHQMSVEVNEEKNGENTSAHKIEKKIIESNNETKSIYDLLEEEIMSSNISAAEKTKKLSRFLKMRGKRVNIMLTGATGSGKSSTINALFNMKFAKV